MLKKTVGVLGLAIAALAVAGCGHDSQTSTVASSNQEGTLVADPPVRTASLTSAAFAAQLGASPSGQSLAQLAGTPT